MGQDKINDPPYWLICGFIGGGAGLLIGLFAFGTAFGICADPTAAEFLYPYCLFAGPEWRDGLQLILGLVQYPIYGALATQELENRKEPAQAQSPAFGRRLAPVA